MSFIFCLIDLVLISVITLDTLGLINQLRKTSHCDLKDYTRVCFTWIFFLFVSSITNCNCQGFCTKVWSFLGLALRIYIAIPLLGGTLKLHHFLIEQNKGVEYAKKAVDVIKSTTGLGAPQPVASET